MKAMNWKKLLKKNTLTEQEWKEAEEAAESFYSCPVGERFNPDYPSVKYYSHTLSRKGKWLGLEFYLAISDRDLPKAQETYEEIQKI